MTKQNIYQRLAAVMAEVSYIQKDKPKDMKYSIVSHDVVTKKVRPALLNHGIVYFPIRCDHQHNGNRAECSMTVRFVNVDEPADFFEVQSFGYGCDSQDKGPGKAMSYAVKYALLKALGLETGDDADHESVEYQPKDPALVATAEDIEHAVSMIHDAENVEVMTRSWKALPTHVGKAPEVIEAAKSRKAELTEREAA